MYISEIRTDKKNPSRYSFRVRFDFQEKARMYMSKEQTYLEEIKVSIEKKYSILGRLWNTFQMEDESVKKMRIQQLDEELITIEKKVRKCDAAYLEQIQTAFLFEKDAFIWFVSKFMDGEITALCGNFSVLSFYGERFRKVERVLINQKNEEVWVLAKVMRKTGIRLRDALELRPEYIHNREVSIVERKIGSRLYEYHDGRKPTISPNTIKQLVVGDDGKYFHITADQFRVALKKASLKQNFGKEECVRDYDFRKYYKERRRALGSVEVNELK